MNRAAAAVLFVLAAAAASPSAYAECEVAAYTGTSAVLTRGERREYFALRASGVCGLPARLQAFGRGDLGGTQDGASVDRLDPESFRSVRLVAGVRRKLGSLRLSAIAATTWSAEGAVGAPGDARLWTFATTVGAPFGDGGYVELGGGHHGPAGGPAALASVNIPVKGGAYAAVDLELPLRVDALRERAWVLTVAAHVRVARLKF